LPPYAEARPRLSKGSDNGCWGRSNDEDAGQIVTSVRQRRRWSRAEKERIVAAAMEPGAVASAVAREAGIQASQLFRWRQQLYGAPRVASLTLKVPTDAAPITALQMSPGVIEVEFKTGARLRICGPVDASIVAAVMQALSASETP
jgi:transposase